MRNSVIESRSTDAGPAWPTPDRPRRRDPLLAVFVAVMVVALTTSAVVGWHRRDRSVHVRTDGAGWLADGQFAVQVGDQTSITNAVQSPVPIASVAKMMTAYVILRERPLAEYGDQVLMTVSRDDVVDTDRRRRADESVVAVAEGEELTERAALLAILLPSANNVAVMAARATAGSAAAFVTSMNRTARALGLHDTTYTDPSGLDPTTVSTALDQLRLARAALEVPGLSALIATKSARIPVAGAVQNTNRLLGRAGFTGLKTGSDDAAGGCFAFRTRRVVGGSVVDVVGVVLGQRGGPFIDAALTAAQVVANRVAPVIAPVSQ
jgi:D-alanyl-D-alanine carboxypeptidase (penicillin-binding protein 5/6)